jgi:hypothetical protein
MIPMTLKELEARVAALEKEIAQLREKQPNPAKKEPWWIAEAGHFANDPVFDEIIRLGKEYRDSLRPGRQKRKAKSKRPTTAGNGRARS